MEIKQFSLQGNKYFSLFLAPSPLSPPSLFLLLSLSHCLALSLTLSLFLPSLSLSHTFSFFSPLPPFLSTPLSVFSHSFLFLPLLSFSSCPNHLWRLKKCTLYSRAQHPCNCFPCDGLPGERAMFADREESIFYT